MNFFVEQKNSRLKSVVSDKSIIALIALKCPEFEAIQHTKFSIYSIAEDNISPLIKPLKNNQFLY